MKDTITYKPSYVEVLRYVYVETHQKLDSEGFAYEDSLFKKQFNLNFSAVWTAFNCPQSPTVQLTEFQQRLVNEIKEGKHL